MQLASYLEGGPLMCMMPLPLHINQKSNYDDDMMFRKRFNLACVSIKVSDQPVHLQSLIRVLDWQSICSQIPSFLQA